VHFSYLSCEDELGKPYFRQERYEKCTQNFNVCIFLISPAKMNWASHILRRKDTENAHIEIWLAQLIFAHLITVITSDEEYKWRSF
jgi:hypothetical protein